MSVDGRQHRIDIEARLIYAALMLTRDVNVCEALLRGIAVARDRLDPEVLAAMGEPLSGEPFELDEELALKVEVRGGSSAAPIVETRTVTSPKSPATLAKPSTTNQPRVLRLGRAGRGGQT